MVLFKRRETILSDEVYRFLHSIKGTSGTLQLNDLMQISQELLNQLESKSEVKKNGGILN